MDTRIRQHETGKINIILHDDSKSTHTKHMSAVLKQHEDLKRIDEAFSSFIGLQDFKDKIKEMYAIRLMQSKREELGLTVPKQVLHMVFKGNPGTGKTTIARKLAEVFGQLNMLSKGHFVEVERADLVGEYVGQTAQKTRSIVQKAMGGVLFVDEAYALARGGEKDFGRESIDTLVKQMEDYHHDFLLILAGYPREMDYFFRLNPGLQSRFPFHIPFYDYNADQLMKIAKQIMNEQGFEMTKKAESKLKEHFLHVCIHRPAHFANGRYVRNLVEQSIRKQSLRLLNKPTHTLEDLIKLTADDLELKHNG